MSIHTARDYRRILILSAIALIAVFTLYANSKEQPPVSQTTRLFEPAPASVVLEASGSEDPVLLLDAPRPETRPADPRSRLAISRARHYDVAPGSELLLAVAPEQREALLRLLASGQTLVTLNIGSQALQVELRLCDEGVVVEPVQALEANLIYQIVLSAELSELTGLPAELLLVTEPRGSVGGELVDFDWDGESDVLFADTGEFVALAGSVGEGTDALQLGLFEDSRFKATDLAAGDIDGDGLADVVLSTLPEGANGSGVVILVNRSGVHGSGTAHRLDNETQQRMGAVGGGAYGMDIHLADLDADGDRDIVLADFEWGVRLYINQGGLQRGRLGQFAERSHLLRWSGGAGASCVATGDVDSDGDLDLFAGFAYGEGVLLVSNLSQAGAANLEWTPDHDALPAVIANVADAAFGDLDNDGDEDLALSVCGGCDRILVNQGNARGYAGVGGEEGRFEDETRYRAPMLLLRPGLGSGVALGRISGSGSLDIAFSALNESSARISAEFTAFNRLLINDGYGFFIEAPLNADGTPPNSLAIRAGDLDNPRNGLLDLYLFNEGINLFLASSRNAAGAGFVSGSPSAGSWQLASDAGSAVTGGDDEAGDFVSGIVSLITEDFDRDGDRDALGFDVDGRLVFLANAGKKDVGALKPAWVDERAFTGMRRLTPGDFDGDGDEDVFVTVNGAGARTSFLLENTRQQGQPFVVKPLVDPVPETLEDSAAADVDRDGDLDLVVATPTMPFLLLNQLRESGRMGFRMEQLPEHPADRIEQILAQDVNGNGLPDVVVVSRDFVRVMENHGDVRELDMREVGIWSEADDAGAAVAVREAFSAVADDVDGDGRTELLVLTADGVLLFDNETPRKAWGRAWRLTAWKPTGGGRPFVAGQVHLVDVDFDGDKDLLAIDAEGVGHLYLNDVQKQFHHDGEAEYIEASRTFREASQTLGMLRSVFAADWDGDGDIDVSLVTQSGSVVLLKNDTK